MPVDKLEQMRDEERAAREARLHAFLARYNSRLSERGEEACEPRVELVKGEAAHEIPEFLDQAKADVLVLGTRSRVGVDALLIGNTAEQVLSAARCSVGAIKPPGFTRPSSGG
jgi:nucleotide-binding universal stress UspA family protein